MNKQMSILLLVSISAFNMTAFAGTMGPISVPSKKTIVGTLSAGPLWASAGRMQAFYLTPEVEKNYTSNSTTSAFPEGELFLGMQKTLPHQLFARLGVALATTGNISSNGVIWDDADPQFDNYNYAYKVQNTKIALKGVLLLDKGSFLMPWISGSIGVGFNYAHSFTNTPLIFEAVPNNNFTNHTNTSFTYSVGAGVQKTLNAHWQTGVGYEFANWGRAGLGRAVGQTLNNGLSLNHVYTNGLIFNITSLS